MFLCCKKTEHTKKVVLNLNEFLSSVKHKKNILKNGLIFILVLNTKEDILKNVGNQTVAGPQWLPYIFFYQSQWGPGQQLFGYQHSSKYLLCSGQE